MKLTFLDKSFVKQVSSTTVCRITCRIPLSKLPFVDEKEKSNLAKRFKAKVTPDGNIEFTCYGVARCCVDDTEKYDYTLGCHIAESKAKQKAYSKAERMLADCVTKVNDVWSALYKSTNKLHELSTYELTHIENLTK